MEKSFYRLKITAKNPATIIYLGSEDDIEGEIIESLVQQETGFMDTSLRPGEYIVHFGMKGPKNKIVLDSDMEVCE